MSSAMPQPSVSTHLARAFDGAPFAPGCGALQIDDLREHRQAWREWREAWTDEEQNKRDSWPGYIEVH